MEFTTRYRPIELIPGYIELLTRYIELRCRYSIIIFAKCESEDVHFRPLQNIVFLRILSRQNQKYKQHFYFLYLMSLQK